MLAVCKAAHVCTTNLGNTESCFYLKVRWLGQQSDGSRQICASLRQYCVLAVHARASTQLLTFN
jgi:hypothetical protein